MAPRAALHLEGTVSPNFWFAIALSAGASLLLAITLF